MPMARFMAGAKWEILIFSKSPEGQYMVVSYDHLNESYVDPLFFSTILDAIPCATMRMGKTLMIPMCILEKPTNLNLPGRKAFDKTEMLLWRTFYNRVFTTGDMVAFLRSSFGMGRRHALEIAFGFGNKMIDAGLAKRSH